tara:strand:- start:556 stop:825 length:270 start_codon:yes stop_codon:yes gene_type:complete
MSFWAAFGGQLAANFLSSKSSGPPPVQAPPQFSTGRYRMGLGSRSRGGTRGTPAAVETRASYGAESRYKAILQKMLREGSVKQAKPPKA